MAATAFTGLNALWVKREKTALAETECRVKGAVMAGYCGGRKAEGGKDGRKRGRIDRRNLRWNAGWKERKTRKTGRKERQEKGVGEVERKERRK